MSRKPKAVGPKSQPAGPELPPEAPPPALQLGARRSPAARLLGSKGSAPSTSSLPKTFGDITPHADSTGPEQGQSRANEHAEGPRHFRRADTWR